MLHWKFPHCSAAPSKKFIMTNESTWGGIYTNFSQKILGPTCWMCKYFFFYLDWADIFKHVFIKFSWNTRYLKKVPILCISMTIMIFKPPNVCKVCPHAPQEGSYIIINYLPSVWVHARVLRTPLGDTNHKWPQDGSWCHVINIYLFFVMSWFAQAVMSSYVIQCPYSSCHVINL